MKCYAVSRRCNIVGYNATYYVLAANHEEALRLAFPYDDANHWHNFFHYYVEEYV